MEKSHKGKLSCDLKIFCNIFASLRTNFNANENKRRILQQKQNLVIKVIMTTQC